jgi:Phosphate-induced protein 1 conserved region
MKAPATVGSNKTHLGGYSDNMKKFISSTLGISALIAVLGLSAFSQYGDIYKIPHGINPHSNSQIWPGFALTTGNTRKTTAMNYYGGPMIETPTIYIIWYGNWNQANGSDTPAGQQIIKDWAVSIGNTPYYDLNKSLSINGYDLTGAVAYGGETSDAGTATTLSDADIQAIVNRNVGSGKPLPYNANGVYFVVTSSNVNESSGFCTNYCGWHTYGNVTAGHVRYSFVGNAKRCLSACSAQSSVSPNNNPGVDGAVSVLSHELEEAATDPDINAWLDSRGYENADKCAWTFGHAQYQTANGAWANMSFGGRDWLIQRNILKSGSSFYCMVNANQN